MEPSDALLTLRTFRDSFYDCLHRRSDALFELTDAILAADALPSPVHLSLQPSHRRGWGSLYAALDRGRIDVEALRELLARHPLASAEGEAPVYAVDVSVWPRCDAEASPLLKASITILRAIRLASPSWPAGPTSSLHNSTSCARARERVGPPPWTCGAADPRRMPTWPPPSRSGL